MRLDYILPWYVIAVLLLLIFAYTILCLINKKYRRPRNFRRIIALLLVATILARPTLPGNVSETASSNITAFFVVDATGSMAVKDVNGQSRLEQAKKDMLEIIDQITIARYAIIVQDNTTYPLLPVSYDKEAAIDVIKNMAIKPTSYSIGTYIPDLLSSANVSIANYIKRFPNGENLVLIFSDGENAFNPGLSDNNATRDLPNGLFINVTAGAVLGYGSETGSEIPYIKTPGIDFSNSDYLPADNKSKADKKYLEQIAEKYNFVYMHRDNGDSFVQSLKLKLNEDIDFNQENRIESRIDLYWLFALALLVLLLWDFYDVMNMVLSEREKKK